MPFFRVLFDDALWAMDTQKQNGADCRPHHRGDPTSGRPDCAIRPASAACQPLIFAKNTFRAPVFSGTRASHSQLLASESLSAPLQVLAGDVCRCRFFK
jgi:hypothetical protein